MSRQIGIFFLLIGLLGAVLFLATFTSAQPVWWLGLLSAISIGVSILIFARTKSAPSPDERFRSYRSYKERRLEKKEEKKKKRRS